MRSLEWSMVLLWIVEIFWAFLVVHWPLEALHSTLWRSGRWSSFEACTELMKCSLQPLHLANLQFQLCMFCYNSLRILLILNKITPLCGPLPKATVISRFFSVFREEGHSCNLSPAPPLPTTLNMPCHVMPPPPKKCQTKQ